MIDLTIREETMLYDAEKTIFGLNLPFAKLLVFYGRINENYFPNVFRVKSQS